jgi:NADH-quinone oxidoreductase subunit B
MSSQVIPANQIRTPEDKSGAVGAVFFKLEDALRWARTKSMWPLLMGLACCAIEMMATFASHFDLARFGMEVYRASPRQADLMIVSGRVSRKMAPVVRQLYDQMPEPKWVIAMGDCASTGGVYNNYAILQGVDEIIPVDVYVSGCPPRPEALMYGILQLHEKIQHGEPHGKIKIEDWGLRG